MNYQDILNISVKETKSTNELAKELLRKKEQSMPFIVQTDFQTDGKGQYSKIWESNAGENLLFSIALKAPKVSIEQQFILSKAVAVSILQVLKNHVDDVFIKWPNDIYVGNKKIAGILIENSIVGPKIDSCIIGIGLNVNQTEFNKNLPNPISLKLLGTNLLDIEDIKKQITNQIIHNWDQLFPMDDFYDKYLYRKGDLGEFRDETGNVFLGVILGVDEIGKLLIRVENNVVKSYTNGEIEYILPKD